MCEKCAKRPKISEEKQNSKYKTFYETKLRQYNETRSFCNFYEITEDFPKKCLVYYSSGAVHNRTSLLGHRHPAMHSCYAIKFKCWQDSGFCFDSEDGNANSVWLEQAKQAAQAYDGYVVRQCLD